MNHEIKQAEKQIKRRDKKKHPTMRVTGVGTKKLAVRLTKSA